MPRASRTAAPKATTPKASAPVSRQGDMTAIPIAEIGLPEETVADVMKEIDTYFATEQAASNCRKAKAAAKSAFEGVITKRTAVSLPNGATLNFAPTKKKAYKVAAGESMRLTISAPGE